MAKSLSIIRKINRHHLTISSKVQCAVCAVGNRKLVLLQCNRNNGTSSTDSEKNYKLVEDMPGPKPILPVLGTSWIYSIFGPYSKEGMLTYAKEDLLAKYGPIYKEHMGGASIVSLHKPEHIETVMRNQGRVPQRVLNEANIYWRRRRPDLYKSVGLVDSTGEEWYDLRHKVSPSVLKPKAAYTFTESLSAVADSFVQTVRNGETKKHYKVSDVRKYLFRYGLEAIWTATHGYELGVLRKDQPEETKTLISLSLDLFDSFAALSLSPPWWKIWPTKTFKTFCVSEERIFRIVNRHTQSIIKQKNKIKEDDSSPPLKTTILERFLSTKDFDVRDVNTVIIDFIAAGIPTTALFLSLLLHRLGKEKKLQKRLHAELDKAVPDPKTTLTASILKMLPLLNATIQEGFRLTTIIPAIMRILPEEIICDEYKIPANTPILCQTRAASISEKYFTLPKQFIPDRWLRIPIESDFISSLQREAKFHNFLVLPFGFGPRMCVGRRLAEREIAVLLAKVLLNFRIESEGEVELCNYFIIGPKHDVPLKFIERKRNYN